MSKTYLYAITAITIAIGLKTLNTPTPINTIGSLAVVTFAALSLHSALKGKR